ALALHLLDEGRVVELRDVDALLVDELHAALGHRLRLVLGVERAGARVDPDVGGLLGRARLGLLHEVGDGVLELVDVDRLCGEAVGAGEPLAGHRGGPDVGDAAALRGGRAAGVEGRLAADRGEGLLAGLRVRLLVGAVVGAAVERQQFELAVADVGLGVEVGDVGAHGVLGRGEQTRHRSGDVGGVREQDGLVGDADLVLEALAGRGPVAATGGVLTTALFAVVAARARGPVAGPLAGIRRAGGRARPRRVTGVALRGVRAVV